MEWLRWILLAIGIVLIGAVYVSGRGAFRGRGRSQQSGLDFTEDLGGEWVGKPTVRRSAEDSPPADDASDPSSPAHRAAREAGSEGEAAPDFLTHSDFDFTVSREPIGAPPGEDIAPAARGHREATPDAAQPPPEPSAAPEPPPEPSPEAGSFPETDPEPELPSAREAPAGGEREHPKRHAVAEREPDPDPDPEPEPEPEPEPDSEPQQMIVLYLAAPEGERLVGAQLAAAFARHGLEHGELGIFHARAGGDGSAERPEPATDFSIANAVEPGSFDPATMDTLSTPGVVLFMRVPGPPSPVNAFDRMIATARSLGEELGARVLDEKKIPLTRQEEQHLRDQVRQTLWHVRPSNRGRR